MSRKISGMSARNEFEFTLRDGTLPRQTTN